jgi:hypothetical protein
MTRTQGKSTCRDLRPSSFLLYLWLLKNLPAFIRSTTYFSQYNYLFEKDFRNKTTEGRSLQAKTRRSGLANKIWKSSFIRTKRINTHNTQLCTLHTSSHMNRQISLNYCLNVDQKEWQLHLILYWDFTLSSSILQQGFCIQKTLFTFKVFINQTFRTPINQIYWLDHLNCNFSRRSHPCMTRQ